MAESSDRVRTPGEAQPLPGTRAGTRTGTWAGTGGTGGTGAGAIAIEVP